MINTRGDFTKRTQEIDQYFNFLSSIDRANSLCNVQYDDLLGQIHYEPIDQELLKILKANGFILLYNLIESTVLKSIEAIFNRIQDQALTYQKLSENLKKLWVNHKGKDLKGIDSINLNKIRQIMRDAAESILINEIAKLETTCVNISGNIDAQEIREIAKKFGFDEIADGRHLVTIKQKRNHLAHGDFSFTDIGKNYSVGDLISFKADAFDYLNNVMNSIEDYITNKKFEYSVPTIAVA